MRDWPDTNWRVCVCVCVWRVQHWERRGDNNWRVCVCVCVCVCKREWLGFLCVSAELFMGGMGGTQIAAWVTLRKRHVSSISWSDICVCLWSVVFCKHFMTSQLTHTPWSVCVCLCVCLSVCVSRRERGCLSLLRTQHHYTHHHKHFQNITTSHTKRLCRKGLREITRSDFSV